VIGKILIVIEEARTMCDIEGIVEVDLPVEIIGTKILLAAATVKSL
jgi:hypothetical protein